MAKKRDKNKQAGDGASQGVKPAETNEGASLPPVLPMLPIRGTVVFPGTVIPLAVGREMSIGMLDEWLPKTKMIGVVAQRDPEVEHPAGEDLFAVGTAVLVLKLTRQMDGTVTLIVHGLSRFAVSEYVQTQPYPTARIQTLADTVRMDKALEAAVRNLRETAVELIGLTPNTPEQAQTLVMNIDDPGHLADFLAANLNIELEQRQDLLEELNVAKRIRAVQVHVARQLDIARLQQKIQADVESHLTDMQRKAYLREQLRAIQKELGGEEEVDERLDELRRQLVEANPPEKVIAEAERELRRLESIPPASPEYSVILSYLETVVELPWQVLSEDNLDLDRARSTLDRDHYDLEKVKKRLIEYLAVRKLNPEGRGPVLCLVGPPGVGKTSLGQSVADALGRKFVRLSLGGIRDEAEIRGHRRTYIGSMPGRIIQELRRAGTRNPVMMLDEIDKLGADFRGDPASALLEVLDPRQNHAFVDRYMDVAFDLSQVLFIATANYMDPVPPALRDRMEVIEIPGYSDRQKLEIAKRYLVPRQLKENGLQKSKCRFQISALRYLIEHYTREAGVRGCERQIGAVLRGIAAQVAAGALEKISIDSDRVSDLLGPYPYTRDQSRKQRSIGVVTGMAYTPVGGELLHIEATGYPGKGALHLTGQIGKVMKESAEAAMSLLRANARSLDIDPDQFAKTDVHVHVPAGAVPKDGPSAGVAMYSVLVSLFTRRKARADVALTGEITLRGLVMAIGGLKEKTLAAMRAGIRQVIVPEENRKDWPQISDDVKKKLHFIFVSHVDQVIEHLLETPTGRSKGQGDQ